MAVGQKLWPGNTGSRASKKANKKYKKLTNRKARKDNKRVGS